MRKDYRLSTIDVVQRRFVAGSYDQTTVWGYTEDGQLKTLTPPGQLTATTLAYNADGLNIGRYAPGLAFTTGFSGVHAPSGLSYGVPALNREYGYEPATGFLNTRIQADSAKEYGYDALGQLSFIKRSTVTDPANDCGQVVEATGEISDICKSRRSGGLLTHSFAYDAVGNRTDHAGYVYESTNRQAWFNGTSYGYDYDGNRTFQFLGNGATVQYGWSATGELTAVRRLLNGVVQDSTTFTYDGLGRRITKTSTVTGAHEYLLDGDNLLAELDAAGAIRTEYTAYPGIDRPHSVLIASTGQRYNIEIGRAHV